VAPTINFGATSGTFTSNSDGTWATNTQWTESFTLSDADEETSNVTANSSGAVDLAGNPEAGSSGTTFDIDTKEPKVTSRVTFDSDGDGHLDQILITTDDVVNDDFSNVTVNVHRGQIPEYNYLNCETGGTALDNQFIANIDELAEYDTGSTPNVEFVSTSSLADDVGNYVSDSQPGGIVATDSALPILVERSYADNATDGSVDQVLMRYSEVVYWNGLDLDQFAIVNNDLTNLDSDGTPDSFSGNGTDTLTLAVSGTTQLTGVSGNTEPTIQYTRSGTAANRVHDAPNNIEVQDDGGVVTIDDKSGPVLKVDGTLPRYYDADVFGDAIVDWAEFEFTENISGSFTSGDWSTTANDLTNFSVTSLDAINQNQLFLNATAAFGVTGVGVAGSKPLITFTNSTQGLTDADLNPIVAFVDVPLEDNARPVVVATIPADTDSSVAFTQDVVIEFSEPMDTTFAHGLQFTVSPNPDGWSVNGSWSNGNKTLDLSHTNFTPVTDYNLIIDQTQISADSGQVTLLNYDTGAPVPIILDFTTQSLRVDTPTPSNPSIVINDGALEASTRDVVLTLSVTDGDEMLIANNSAFQGASWETFLASKQWTLTSGNGNKTVYVKYRYNQTNQSTVASDSIILNVPTQGGGGGSAPPSTPPSRPDEPKSGDEPLEDPASETTSQQETIPADESAMPVVETFAETKNGHTFPLSNTVIPQVDFMTGRWVKTIDHSTVYLLKNNGDRYVYPTQEVWESYFGDDFSLVELISADDLASYDLQGNVPFAAGSLISTPLNNKVYYVEAGAVIRWLTSEAVAEKYFGSDWRSLVVDLPDIFMTDYVEGPPVN